jgi:hypothetical protein
MHTHYLLWVLFVWAGYTFKSSVAVRAVKSDVAGCTIKSAVLRKLLFSETLQSVLYIPTKLIHDHPPLVTSILQIYMLISYIIFKKS